MSYLAGSPTIQNWCLLYRSLPSVIVIIYYRPRSDGLFHEANHEYELIIQLKQYWHSELMNMLICLVQFM